MSYELSFSNEFFADETFPYETKVSARPTSVYQAIVSLDKATKVQIAREVLHLSSPVLAVMAEDFACKVLDKVRETNTCGDLSSPVDVWIDPAGWYTLDVYDSFEMEASK